MSTNKMDVPARSSADAPEAPTPWYRVGMVWLVVGGPLTVVVAATLTAVIAIRGADVVITEPAALRVVTQPDSNTPALQARNHAATAAPADR